MIIRTSLVVLAATAVAGLAAACGGSGTGADAAPGADALASDADDVDPPSDGGADAVLVPYRHTIVIDGTNDFAAGDTFATTSAAYTAYVSWDATDLYVGYAGPDLDPAAPDTASKWVFVYVDVDPGAATGAAESQLYNTQRATFPPGFGAEHYYRWKCDGTFATLETHDAGAWTTLSSSVPAARSGDYLEIAIPLASLGAPAAVGIATWMINEKPGVESAFAGLYPDAFTDGYDASLPVRAYLHADFAAPQPPADPVNRRPSP